MAFKVGDRSQCDLHSNGAGTVIAIERVCERLVNDIDEIEEEKWW